MSTLTNPEKRKLELLFGMESGYVLDFNNRSFSEFVRDSINVDIMGVRYEYASASKANRLRKLWQIDSDVLVAKLLDDLLDYRGAAADQATSEVLEAECRLIVARIAGHGGHPTSTPKTEPPRILSEKLARLQAEFFQLSTEPNRNRAGLALESVLNRLFDAFHLNPRQPFRVVGEQIDGSFLLDGEVYLLESKWEHAPLSEADLLVFRGKIEGKSTFTRGVFIALNDVTTPGRHAITQGKAPSFFVMNGHDLSMILSGAISLPEYLRKRVRLLAEEGRMFVPYSDVDTPQ